MTSDALGGRTAVVTGGGTGIGRAVACELAALGARTFVVGRRRETLEETASLASGPVPVQVLEADLRGPDLLDAIDAVAPAVDVLVNNASSYAAYARIEHSPDAAFAEVYATVVDASRRLVQHVLPGMTDRGFGRIVTIGSLAGELGGAGQAAYSTAKAALVGLTRTVALEAGGHGVTANLVVPGLVDTERVRRAVDDDLRVRMVSAVPVGRIGTPGEVAHAVGFLASPRAGYVTGVVLPVSGGLGLGVVPSERA